jgi:alpha-ribazole phosphatase
MEVYLIRHTPVDVDKNRCYGQSEVPLAPSFLADSQNLKEQLPKDFDLIFCSPSARCKVLASELNLGDIHYRGELLEMNFGDWENKNWNDLDQQSLMVWMNDFVHQKTPNGESLSLLYDRVSSFMNELRKFDKKKILIITHAGVIRCIWAFLLQIQLSNIFKIPVGFNEVMSFELSKTAELDKILKKG